MSFIIINIVIISCSDQKRIMTHFLVLPMIMVRNRISDMPGGNVRQITFGKIPSSHNNGIAGVVLQLVNQATCFGRFIRPSSGLKNNVVN